MADGAKDLSDHVLDLLIARPILSKLLQQLAITAFHNEVGPRGRSDELLSIHDVDVRPETPHEVELGARGRLLLLVSAPHHLRSEQFIRLLAADLVHDGGTSLAQLLQFLIGLEELVMRVFKPQLKHRGLFVVARTDIFNAHARLMGLFQR